MEDVIGMCKTRQGQWCGMPWQRDWFPRQIDSVYLIPSASWIFVFSTKPAVSCRVLQSEHDSARTSSPAEFTNS